MEHKDHSLNVNSEYGLTGLSRFKQRFQGSNLNTRGLDWKGVIIAPLLLHLTIQFGLFLHLEIISGVPPSWWITEILIVSFYLLRSHIQYYWNYWITQSATSKYFSIRNLAYVFYCMSILTASQPQILWPPKGHNIPLPMRYLNSLCTAYNLYKQDLKCIQFSPEAQALHYINDTLLQGHSFGTLIQDKHKGALQRGWAIVPHITQCSPPRLNFWNLFGKVRAAPHWQCQ